MIFINRFENTNLWQDAFAVRNQDNEATQRRQFHNSLELLRERAAILAGEIARDLPDFTVHDITHIDALWEMADILVDSKFQLNPAETYVLGGAFLIHDLGLGLAAYPGGIAELKKSQLWHDTLLALKRQSSKYSPSLLGNDAEIEKETVAVVLRELHAKHAAKLPLISWKSGEQSYYLIENSALRSTYGEIMGLIAYSHWWSVDELAKKFNNVLGAPGGYSKDWIVDPLKIACLFRASDAIHLDERRAPGFLRALRKPKNNALLHWIFQEKLYQPRLEFDRVTYTSKASFTSEEFDSWWLCYDSLKIVDKELRLIDSLLADNNRPRLLARSVSYIDNPTRLGEVVQTEGWEPVNTEIKATAVAALVSSLGGEQLYGKSMYATIRELIQNSADAVRARRLLEDNELGWGHILVSMGKDSVGSWVSVEDTGIGMSSKVLTGPFLDFGTSFWGSHLMHNELPGLESKGFSSTGKYGIGFFSVFMLGERVQVITRRYEKAREDTLVLEFNNGVLSRPLLRCANLEERLREGGTRIKIWLKRELDFEEAFLGNTPGEKKWTIQKRLAWLCPSLDVDLCFKAVKGVQTVVKANDWIKIDGVKLLSRLFMESNIDLMSLKQVANNLKIIKSSEGKIVGRACIYHRDFNRKRDSAYGIVTVGGFRSCELTGIIGILTGNSYVASRNIGAPEAGVRELSQWASEQSSLIKRLDLGEEDESEAASIIRKLGGTLGDVKIALNADGWVSFNDLALNPNIPTEIILVQDAALHNEERAHGKVSMYKNVFAVAMGSPMIVQTGTRWHMFDWPEVDSELSQDSHRFYSVTLTGAIIEALSISWKVSVLDVYKHSTIGSKEKMQKPIGLREGKEVYLDVQQIIRPL